MRDSYHAPHVTTKLIIVLLVAFFFESLFHFYGQIDVLGHLGLTLSGIKAGKVWQLLTFQFLHSVPWPWHVLFNCLGLWFFGRPVEEMLGAKRFLILYFLAGITGGLLQIAATAVLPGHMDVPVVGASAGVCGIIAIFCSLHPMQELTAWIYFFPVTVRARYFLIFLGGLSIFGTIVPFDSIAYGAHLGGILLGIAYVHWGEIFLANISRWRSFKSPPRNRQLVKTAVARTSAWRRPQSETSKESSAREFMSREVDPILDKISAQGIHSLTAREREILDSARKKMARR